MSCGISQRRPARFQVRVARVAGKAISDRGYIAAA
jgi:hypothetical protein